MNELDLHKVGVRGINSQLHSLPKNTNEKHWVIHNPMGQHSIAVGLDAPLQIDIRGHVGFYCGGMNKDAELTIHGHAGVGTAENMMSGVVWVKGKVASLGADCIEKEMRPEHLADLERLLKAAERKEKPSDFRRYGSARKLYNFSVDHADAY